jgi:hypothetical protein
MKRIIMSLLLIAAVSGVSFAQEPMQQPASQPQSSEGQGAKVQEHRELMNIRLQILKEELKLTDEQYEKFVPVYREYNKSMNFNRVKVAKINWSNASKQEINTLLKARLDNTINTAMVRKNYILIFEEVITPRQVAKLYKIEDKLSARAREELQKRQSNK